MTFSLLPGLPGPALFRMISRTWHSPILAVPRLQPDIVRFTRFIKGVSVRVGGLAWYGYTRTRTNLANLVILVP